ncbi:MAG: FAD-dependent monooxygenase [Myxococcota bacterium]
MVAVDVVVVGAGPVGCAGALRLHHAGLRVLLLERSAWDRVSPPQLTSITPRALHDVESLGLAAPIREACVTRGITFRMISHRGAEVRKQHPPSEARLYFHRPPVDLAMRRRVASSGVPHQAGVRRVEPLVHGGRVTGVRYENADGEHTVQAALVLAADGRGSRLARAVSLPAAEVGFQRVYQGRLLATDAWPDDTLAVLGTGMPGVTFLVFSWRREAGRAVYVELETDLARHPEALSTASGGPEAHFERAARSQPGLAGLLAASHPIEEHSAVTLMGVRRTRLFVPGMCLVGDAAATVDPIGSSGMLLGVQGVVDLAERIIRDGVAGCDYRAWEQGHLARVREIARYAALLRSSVDHPWRMDLAARVMAAVPLAREHALGTMNGTRPFTEMWSPSRMWSLLRGN